MTLSKKLKETVFHFFRENLKKETPILLGMSGGADSTALYLLLKEWGGLDFGVAHVDHRWREESAQEAEILKKTIEAEGVPFYLKTLDKANCHGNLEDACRKERARFFAQLCKNYGYQGVLLGHHADDQAETVLKRVFEGASICRFSGIEPVRDIEGVCFYRPLLQIPKKLILQYLSDSKSDFFDDPSNRDVRFLRAKMRQEIIPSLSECFGKNIAPALCSIGDEAREVTAYLDKKVEPFLRAGISGPFGLCLDLSVTRPDESLELKHLIKAVCRKMGLALSKDQCSVICSLIKEGKADKRVEINDATVNVDRRRLFIIPRKINPLPSTLSLKEGTIMYGSWKVSLSPLEADKKSETLTGWSKVWEGKVSVVLPQGLYSIGAASPGMLLSRGSSIGKFWSDHKIPAFMRKYVPVIFKKDEIVHEFLSGKGIGHAVSEGVCITLSYQSEGFS